MLVRPPSPSAPGVRRMSDPKWTPASEWSLRDSVEEWCTVSSGSPDSPTAAEIGVLLEVIRSQMTQSEPASVKGVVESSAAMLSLLGAEQSVTHTEHTSQVLLYLKCLTTLLCFVFLYAAELSSLDASQHGPVVSCLRGYLRRYMEGALKKALNRSSLDEAKRADEARQLAAELVGVVLSAYGIEDTSGADQLGAAQVRALATLAGDTAQLWELISKSSRDCFDRKKPGGDSDGQRSGAADVQVVLARAVVEAVLGRIGVDASAIVVAGKSEDGGKTQTKQTNKEEKQQKQQKQQKGDNEEHEIQGTTAKEENERHDDGSSATILSLVAGRLKDHVEAALQMAAALLDDKVSAAVRILVQHLQSGASSAGIDKTMSKLCLGGMKFSVQFALEARSGISTDSEEGRSLVKLLFEPIEKSGKDPKALAAMVRDPRLMWAEVARAVSMISKPTADDAANVDRNGVPVAEGPGLLTDWDRIGVLLTVVMERTLLGKRLKQIGGPEINRVMGNIDPDKICDLAVQILYDPLRATVAFIASLDVARCAVFRTAFAGEMEELLRERLCNNLAKRSGVRPEDVQKLIHALPLQSMALVGAIENHGIVVRAIAVSSMNPALQAIGTNVLRGIIADTLSGLFATHLHIPNARQLANIILDKTKIDRADKIAGLIDNPAQLLEFLAANCSPTELAGAEYEDIVFVVQTAVKRFLGGKESVLQTVNNMCQTMDRSGSNVLQVVLEMARNPLDPGNVFNLLRMLGISGDTVKELLSTMISSKLPEIRDALITRFHVPASAASAVVDQIDKVTTLLEDDRWQMCLRQISRDPAQLPQILVAMLASIASTISDTQHQQKVSSALIEALGTLVGSKLQHELEQRLHVQHSAACEIGSVVKAAVGTDALADMRENLSEIVSGDRFWEHLPSLLGSVLSELEANSNGVLEHLVSAATAKLHARLQAMSIPGAERAAELIESMLDQDPAEAFKLVAMLVQDPEEAVFSVVQAAEDLGIDGMAEALRSIIGSRLQGILLKTGVPSDIAEAFATTVNTADFDQMQDKLGTLATHAEKIKEPKDFVDWFWTYIAGSATSKALVALKGFVRARFLPLFDLVSDVLVAVALSQAAGDEDSSDNAVTLTGTRDSDALMAWVLLGFGWSALVLAVAVSLGRKLLRDNSCGILLWTALRALFSDRFFFWNPARRLRGCSCCGWGGAMLWALVLWPVLTALVLCAVLVLIVAPAVVAAPFVVVFCEIYLLLKHPDGSVPQNSQIAGYENLREVVEALCESLPQTVFQIGLVLAPVAAGADMEWDPMLLASITVSVTQALRYYMLIKRLSLAYQRPKLFGWNSIVGELVSVGDPAKAHVPFHLVLRTKSEISFEGCGPIRDAQCVEIADALVGNNALKSLSFSPDNELDAACTRALSVGLKRNRAVRVVSMQTIYVPGSREWARTSKCSRVNARDAVLNEDEEAERERLLGHADEAVVAFADGCLSGNMTLRELRLSVAITNPATMKDLAKALGATKIDVLELHFQMQISDANGRSLHGAISAWGDLGTALARCKALRSLSVGVSVGVSADEGEGHIVAKPVPRATDDSCTAQFLQGLSKNTTLQTFSLNDLPMGTSSATMLKSWLSRRTALQSLSIHTCELPKGLLTSLSERLAGTRLRSFVVTYIQHPPQDSELSDFFANARKSAALRFAAISQKTPAEDKRRSRCVSELRRAGRLFALLGSGWNALLGNLCFRIERNSAEDLVQQAIDESTDRANTEPLRSLLDLVQHNSRPDALLLQQLHGATGITAAKAVLKHVDVTRTRPKPTSSTGNHVANIVEAVRMSSLDAVQEPRSTRTAGKRWAAIAEAVRKSALDVLQEPKRANPYIGFDDCELDDGFAAVLSQSLADCLCPRQLSLRKHAFSVGGIKSLSKGLEATGRIEELDLSGAELGWEAISRLFLACDHDTTESGARVSQTIRDWAAGTVTALLCLAAATVLSVTGALTCWSGNSHQDGSWSGSADGDPDCALSTAVLVAGLVAMGVAVSWLAAGIAGTSWRKVLRRRRLAKVKVVPADAKGVGSVDGAAGAARQRLLLPGLDVQFPLRLPVRKGEKPAKETNDWGHLKHQHLSGTQRNSVDKMARLIQRNLGTGGKAALEISSDVDAVCVDLLRLLVSYAPGFRGMDIGAYDGRVMIRAEREPAGAKSGQGLLALRDKVENGSGVTALMLAANRGNTEIARALLAAGAEVNVKDGSGQTALTRAADSGRTDIVRDLLAAGAEFNAKDKNGRTALMAAAVSGHTEVAQALLEAGAEVNTKDNDGRTALMHQEIRQAKPKMAEEKVRAANMDCPPTQWP